MPTEFGPPQGGSGLATALPRTARRWKRVAINGRFLTQAVTGVQRYARELVGAIDALLVDGTLQGFDVQIIAPSAAEPLPGLQAIALRREGSLGGHAWEQFELPRLCEGRLLLNLCNTAPAFMRQQVVAIHDAAVFDHPETYSFAFRTWYRVLLRRVARKSRGVVTPSEFSRRGIAQACAVDASRIHVVPHGREHALRAAAPADALERHGLGRRPYVLAVSSMAANKNFDTVVRAAGLLERDVDVVIVGGRNAKVFAGDRAALPAHVRCLGYVSDGDLRALYERAMCLVYPSWYEGFGFPPLEAMACGCPVVVSNAASLPEVCGTAALYFEPRDASALVAHLQALIDDRAVRERLREAGERQAARFSWRTSALAHMQVLEQVLHG